MLFTDRLLVFQEFGADLVEDEEHRENNDGFCDAHRHSLSFAAVPHFLNLVGAFREYLEGFRAFLSAEHPVVRDLSALVAERFPALSAARYPWSARVKETIRHDPSRQS
jgi:hypothetical protein